MALKGKMVCSNTVQFCKKNFRNVKNHIFLLKVLEKIIIITPYVLIKHGMVERKSDGT